MLVHPEQEPAQFEPCLGPDRCETVITTGVQGAQIGGTTVEISNACPLHEVYYKTTLSGSILFNMIHNSADPSERARGEWLLNFVNKAYDREQEEALEHIKFTPADKFAMVPVMHSPPSGASALLLEYNEACRAAFTPGQRSAMAP